MDRISESYASATNSPSLSAQDVCFGSFVAGGVMCYFLDLPNHSFTIEI